MAPTRQPRATIDFETRSACSLRDCGPWRYSLDPSTEVLCLVFRLPHWPARRTALWHPDFPELGLYEADCHDDLLELIQWIMDGKLVEAHNAWFERCIWTNILVPRYLFPAIEHRQWRCSAAKAAAHALPRALDDALAALGMKIRKDAEGSKVMKKMTKPRKPRKAEREAWAKIHGNRPHRRLYHEDRHLLDQLFAYCRQDVLAEEALSHVLDDLSPQETELYLLDQQVNERGFQIDREAVDAALNLISREQKRYARELATLTEGAVEKATQRQQMMAWLESHGHVMVDTQKTTIDEDLQRDDLNPIVRRALQLMRALGRSSTAKYVAMRNWMSPVDDRIRGGLLYHGASTGRWSGSGVQPHNFPKGTLKIKDYDSLWNVIKTRRRALITKLSADVLEVLSHALRSAITATPGRRLFVADYAAIEARVLLWLAGDEEALDVFRNGEDIYCDMASAIYGRPITKDKDPGERQLGKVAILGLGYQMGASKFVDTAATYGITIDEVTSSDVVTTYRQKYWRVKAMWYEQEDAAIHAVNNPNQRVVAGKVVWRKEGRFLFCTLPSGRRLAYPDPKVVDKRMSWGEIKPSLTYMAVNALTRKWARQTTYGGMLVENITQAVARDLLAAAMLRCEQSDTYDPVLSVHDEIIAEADEGTGVVHEFEQMMAECPKWAAGCPVAAEGWAGFRYHK